MADRIPSVRTYRIAVTDSRYHVFALAFVDAPNRTFVPDEEARAYHLEAARKAAARLRIKDEARA